MRIIIVFSLVVLCALTTVPFNKIILGGVSKSLKNEFKLTLQEAKKGVSEEQNKVGWMYDQGIGVSSNPKKAVSWYRKAANQGFRQAQINLGVMYEIGRGIKQDSREAENWYLKSNKNYN